MTNDTENLGSILNDLRDQLAKKRAKIERLKTELDALKAQEPVAAQHRFRHPQKTMPDWSEWQPCKIAPRESWSIDSQGYEVEYRALYANPVPSVPDEWQPIATAPKDGTQILLATPSGKIASGCWHVPYGVWAWPFVMVEPTHWMSSPAAPKPVDK